MGSIMCLGVSVSNSVMLVTFMDEHWKGGASVDRGGHPRRGRAAAADPDDRLRDDRRHGADGAGAGAGEPDAGPAGLAVIGGLVMSTFATLLVLPSIFAVVIGRRASRSPSIYPDDRESVYYDPEVFAADDEVSPTKAMPPHPDDGHALSSVSTRRSPTDRQRDAPVAGEPTSRCPAPPAPMKDSPLTWRTPDAATPFSPTDLRIVSPAGRRLVFWLVAALAAHRAAAGKARAAHTSVSKPPTVQIIQPAIRKIVRVVGQPSFIESLRAHVDLSQADRLYREVDRRHRRQGEEGRRPRHPLRARAGRGLRDEEGDRQARRGAGRAGPASWWRWPRPTSRRPRRSLDEAKAILAKYQAEVERWDTEVKRLKHEVDRGVVDPQILLESTNQWKSSIAARDAAKATITKAEAELLSKQATLAKAKVDVAVAQADLAVATSEAKRLEAWVGYLTLTAPFDGVIVARNANTFDFVLPSTGDPTAMTAVLPTCRPRACRADLRGRPHRHRPDLRRHPRAGRQLRPDRDQGDRARPGVPRRADPGHASRAPPGPSTSRAARSVPRSTCPTPAASSCPACTPTPR